jgi:CheY-like chemotaxis protein
MLADPRETPFTLPVRLTLLVLGAGAVAGGTFAVFVTANGTGAAALITAGVALGALGLVGPYVEAFSFGGFETRLFRKAAASLDAAIDRAASKANVSVSLDDRSGALTRAERHAELLSAARVLWVDDSPGGNDAERNVLQAFGATVDLALDTEEALGKLRRNDYVCVISDMRRPKSEVAGKLLVERMEEEKVARWTIFYVMDLKRELGTPPGALGITNRPDHLLHLVLDAVERDAYEPTRRTRTR